MTADPTAERVRKNPQKVLVVSMLKPVVDDLGDIAHNKDIFAAAGVMKTGTNDRILREMMIERGYQRLQRRFGGNPVWCWVKDGS